MNLKEEKVLMNFSVMTLLLARRQNRRSRGNVDAFNMLTEKHLCLSKRTVQCLCFGLWDELGQLQRGLSIDDQVICALCFFATAGFHSAVASEKTILLSQLPP